MILTTTWKWFELCNHGSDSEFSPLSEQPKRGSCASDIAQESQTISQFVPASSMLGTISCKVTHAHTCAQQIEMLQIWIILMQKTFAKKSEKKR